MLNAVWEALPGTFEVSTVCNVGEGAEGTDTDCTCASFVGLKGCTGPWAKFGVEMGTKLVGADVPVTGCTNLCPVTTGCWDAPIPSTGVWCPGW